MKPLEILLLAILGGFVAIFLLLSREYNPTAALFPQRIAIASLLFLAVLIIRARANSVDPVKLGPCSPVRWVFAGVLRET